MFSDLTPGAPLRYFTEISAIPRASGNERGIADYLERFADARGLFCYRDAHQNVFIKKPATKGMEQRPALLLQAHTDMVAEKNKDSAHNFEKEGIALVREGNMLRADGTTLGADNGCGVSLMLAVLDECEAHPALECLFTASEEIGLVGAAAFDYRMVSAKSLLNFDGGCEQEIIVGCCGGLRSDFRLQLSKKTARNAALRVRIGGLCGGHSGEDIGSGRQSALSLMARLLARLPALCIAEINGGDKDNAIARECEAVLCLPDPEAARAVIEREFAELYRHLVKEDRGLGLTVQPCVVTACYDAEDSARILHLLATPMGVLAMQPDGKQVRCSRNVASVRTDEQGVGITVSQRAPLREELDTLREELEIRAAAVDAEISHHGAYPGWESPTDSSLVQAWQSAYQSVTGKHTNVTTIHAGLECGLISDRVPGLEAVCVGGNMYDLHTPAERMELDSFLRMYRTLLHFLQVH